MRWSNGFVNAGAGRGFLDHVDDLSLRKSLGGEKGENREKYGEGATHTEENR